RPALPAAGRADAGRGAARGLLAGRRAGPGAPGPVRRPQEGTPAAARAGSTSSTCSRPSRSVNPPREVTRVLGVQDRQRRTDPLLDRRYAKLAVLGAAA